MWIIGILKRFSGFVLTKPNQLVGLQNVRSEIMLIEDASADKHFCCMLI